MSLRIIRPEELEQPQGFVPKLSSRVFPDATSEQMRFLQSIMDYMRENNSRVKQIEQAVGLTGGDPLVARKGEEDIFGNALVHVDDAGIAWLAVNTDSSLYATHVAESIAVEQVRCIPIGVQDIRCLPFADTGPYLYLSDKAGFATDTEPSADDGATVQLVGRKHGRRNENNSLCKVLFQPEIPGDGRGRDRDVDGGSFDEREVLIQARRGSGPDRVVTTLAEGEFGWDTDLNQLFVGDGVTLGGKAVGGGASKGWFIPGVPAGGGELVGRIHFRSSELAGRSTFSLTAFAQHMEYGMNTSASTRLYFTFNSTSATGGTELALGGTAQFAIKNSAISTSGNYIYIYCTESAGHSDLNLGVVLT